MLRELKITNLALISSLCIELGDGLSVLTGETGAGKSIILQSINLLYGAKAAGSWVRSGADKAVVEALFECDDNAPIIELLHEQGFETEDNTLILKRIVSARGSSRYYLNGSLATGKLVGQVAENLISVASQHDHQQLLDPRFHLDFLDAFADLTSRRSGLARLYDKWRAKRSEYQEIKQLEQDKEQRRDFLSFQCKEIEDANIVVGEDDELDQEKNRLRAVEDLRRLGGSCYGALDGHIVDSMAEVRNDLAKMAVFDTGLEKLAEEVSGYGYQLEEAAGRLREYLDGIGEDPERLDEVTARIDLLQQIKRKYGPTLEEVLVFGQKAADQLQELDEMDRTLDSLAKEVDDLREELESMALELSEDRREAAKNLVAAIDEELQFLSLNNAEFEIDFGDHGERSVDEMSRTGWDRPEFLFSANPGEPLKPMVKVASGGELSRLMLALKCILAKHDLVDTVVFDEIDAGISGKAAESVARKIKELSGHHQVLCITHLPQIASYAKEHFTVSKNVSEERTHTTIELLSDEMKVDELARMLDGESVTDGTRKYVKELLGRNRS